jgi:hypothetical protein
MLDSITWGNPFQKHLPYLEENASPLEKHIPQLTNFTFPKNSSKGTREELNQLVDYIEELKKDEQALKRYRAYDISLTRVFAQVIMEQNLGEKGADIVDKLLDETLPLLIKLKFYFQRPRPYQLAEHYKLKLFPFESKSADSPSYPSGHALQSKLICHVLGNHFPEKFDYFERLAKDIEYSRLYMGIHYQSDVDYSLYIAEVIIRDKDFKAKYGL